jgi:hypothetical protein
MSLDWGWSLTKNLPTVIQTFGISVADLSKFQMIMSRDYEDHLNTFSDAHLNTWINLVLKLRISALVGPSQYPTCLLFRCSPQSSAKVVCGLCKNTSYITVILSWKSRINTFRIFLEITEQKLKILPTVLVLSLSPTTKNKGNNAC